MENSKFYVKATEFYGTLEHPSVVIQGQIPVSQKYWVLKESNSISNKQNKEEELRKQSAHLEWTAFPGVDISSLGPTL
jgi:hypothetical protein